MILAAKSCNFAIVMAKLIIDNREHGIHAFVVQLRSLKDHRVLPGLEVGDIGKKFGFDATDNGYLKFDKLRIPRNNMLMQFARVTVDGKFERVGSELLMYAGRKHSIPFQNKMIENTFCVLFKLCF